MQASIRPANDISFVGPYQPTTYSFGGYVKGVKPADLLRGQPEFGLVSFTVEFARSLKLGVTATPAVSGEPAHGWVVGKKTRGVMRRLAAECRIEILPPPLT